MDRYRKTVNGPGMFDAAYKTARKIVIGVIGGTIVLVGVIMLVTPGPAVVVIPAGLGVLAIEFAWARRWLKRLRERAGHAFGWDREKTGRPGKTEE